MKNKKKFSECMSVLSEIFDKEISKSLQVVYWDILNPYDDEKCIKAFNRVVKECKFFPRPAELLSFIDKETPNKSELWEKVMKSLSSGNTPTDPTILRIVNILGGWEYLQQQGYSDLVWIEKRFKKYLDDINSLPAITSGNQDSMVNNLLTNSLKTI